MRPHYYAIMLLSGLRPPPEPPRYWCAALLRTFDAFRSPKKLSLLPIMPRGDCGFTVTICALRTECSLSAQHSTTATFRRSVSSEISRATGAGDSCSPSTVSSQPRKGGEASQELANSQSTAFIRDPRDTPRPQSTWLWSRPREGRMGAG